MSIIRRRNFDSEMMFVACSEVSSVQLEKKHGLNQRPDHFQIESIKMLCLGWLLCQGAQGPLRYPENVEKET